MENQQINYFIVVFIALTLMLIVFLCTGCQGKQGNVGPQGIQGVPGQTGPQGPVGATIPVYTQPATQGECLNGGVDITVGSTTTSICNGVNGVNGQNGTNATPIEFIQFCEGFTPAYPGTFPEYGIVEGNNVYGVYSANGGFLALLPPGQYSSDGINASCTFTINADGTVTQ